MPKSTRATASAPAPATFPSNAPATSPFPAHTTAPAPAPATAPASPRNASPERKHRRVQMQIRSLACQNLAAGTVMPDFLAREIFTRFCLMPYNRSFSCRYGALITWIPKHAEMFLLFYRGPAAGLGEMADLCDLRTRLRELKAAAPHIDQTLTQAKTFVEAIFSNLTAYEVCNERTEQSFVHFPSHTSIKMPRRGLPSIHLTNHAPSNTCLACWHVVNNANTPEQSVHIIVFDILCCESVVFDCVPPALRHLKLSELSDKGHLPKGFSVQWKGDQSAFNSLRPDSEFAASKAHGIGGIMEFTDNALQPLMRSANP